MENTMIPTLTCHDGLVLPRIGLGTYKINGDAGVISLLSAMDTGYRLIDSATRYDNEKEVGEAVAKSSIPRDKLIITTKLPGNGHGLQETKEACAQSLRQLGLEYIDLYLIHWPNPSAGKYVDAWRAMIELKEEGKVRSIGVCNFTEEHLTNIIDATGVVPSVNQIELHPYFPQAQMRAIHKELGIQTESWSPLGKNDELRNEKAITDLASARGVTPAQLILRWHVQLDTIPLPKSADPVRQKENLDIFDFELSDIEVEAIASLERGRLWGGDPNTHEEY